MNKQKQPENVTTLLEPEKGEPLITYSQVDGTPFRIAHVKRNDTTQHAVLLGNTRVSDFHDQEEVLVERIERS